MKQISMNLGGAVHSFERARYTRRQRDALTLARCLREVMHPADAERLASSYAALSQNPDANRWTFVMISPAQNAAVVRWLSEHSKRRSEAVRLWAELFTVLHPTSGEIMADRATLADRIGIAPREVSKIMGELTKINAIRKAKDGRKVRYGMNPNIATHLPDPALRETARDRAGPLLVLMEGGRASG
jgi:hypothetical protein